MKVKIGNIAQLINGDRGKNYPSQNDITDKGDIPFVNAGHLQEGFICFDDMNYITEEKYNCLNSGKFIENDILYCLRGSLGKKAIVRDSIQGAIASSLVIIRANAEIAYPDYLMFALDSPSILKQLKQANNGSSQPNLSAESVRNYIIDLPEKEAQRAIVAKLANVKSIINNRKKELQYFDTLIKARFIEMFGAITETVPLSFYIESLTAGKSLAGEEECQNKVLKTGAATYDYFDPSQVKNLPIGYEPLPEHQIHNGDVIISRMNTTELVGAAAYVWQAPERTYLPDRLWKAELTDRADPIFVWQAIVQPKTKEAIRKIAGGTSGSMKNISKPGLLSLHVKKVELEQQKQFAAFVAHVDKSKVVVQAALEKAQLLFDSLMQQYFG